MRALVRRDLADASLAGLSADRRFATAYNAALLTANMAIACAGYRVTAKTGHHKISFESIKLALGAGSQQYADYFETCRRKRNLIDYTRLHVATETARDLVPTGCLKRLCSSWPLRPTFTCFRPRVTGLA